MNEELKSAFTTACHTWPETKSRKFTSNRIAVMHEINAMCEKHVLTVVERAMIMLEVATQAYEELLETAEQQLILDKKV